MPFRRRARLPSKINPVSFLGLAIRQLETALELEKSDNYEDTLKAHKCYNSTVKVFTGPFGMAGWNGQDRIDMKPVKDKLVLLNLAQIAHDIAAGYDRTYAKLEARDLATIRNMDYYGTPQAPVNVAPAVTFLRSKAEQFPTAPPPIRTIEEINKARESEAEEKYPIKSCQICVDPFSKDAPRPLRPPTANCSHSAGFCKSCISQSIEASLELRGAALEIPCPDPECEATLTREDVREWATEEVFARYDMLTLRELLRNDRELFVWCQNPMCYHGQIHLEGAEKPKVDCERCGHSSCFTHSVPWHSGKTCSQYDRALPIKDRFNRAVSRVEIWWSTRKCPGCHQPIRKNGGCRHMSCRCGYNFTWYYAPIHWRRWIPFIPRRDPGI